MPVRAPRPCAYPGCSAVAVGSRYCNAHGAYRATQEYYATLTGWLYHSRRWRKARAIFLAQHPLCAMCGGPANVVDHITPHRGKLEVFWDEGNWQALCVRCHAQKTNAEQG